MSYIKYNNGKDLSKDSVSFKNESSLKFENNYLISDQTNLKIYSNKFNEKEKIEKNMNIIFTPLFNEMVSLIHFGIATNKSLIFEGFPGQGKQTAINYVCNLLDYSVENIIITSNFSVKDLFKKIVVSSKNNEVELEEIETKLNEKLHSKNKIKIKNNKKNKRKKIEKGNDINAEQNLDNKNNNKNILFVFHDIHKAESDVLSKLSEIFKKNYDDNSFSFIGLINIKESLIERNTYYYNYFYNSIII